MHSACIVQRTFSKRRTFILISSNLHAKFYKDGKTNITYKICLAVFNNLIVINLKIKHNEKIHLHPFATINGTANDSRQQI